MAVRVVLERAEKARSDRDTLKPVWDAIKQLAMPTRLYWVEHHRSANDPQYAMPYMRRLRSSAASRAAELSISTLYAMIAAPGSARVELIVGGADGQRLARTATVSTWGRQVSAAVIGELTAKSGMLDPAFHQALADVVLLGSAVLFAWSREEGPPYVRFRHYPLEQCAFELAHDGTVDTLFIFETLTDVQARKRWPQLKRRPNETREFVFVCFPATEPDMVELVPREVRAAGHDYFYAWVEKRSDEVVEVGGFPEKPFAVARWITVGNSPYGRSPAMGVLGDMLTANDAADMMLRGIAKFIDPPWAVTDGSLFGEMDLNPGAVTYVAGDQTPTPLLPPGASRLDMGEAALVRSEAAIREGFAVPLVLSAPQAARPATQAMIERQERDRAIAPLVVRMQHEMLDDIIWRTFGILLRKRQVPPPPEVLDGRPIRLQFQNAALVALRQGDAAATMQLLEWLAPWAQASNEVLDLVNPDAVGRVLAEGAGVPPEVLRDEGEIRRLREARRQVQEAQLALAQAQGLAEVAKVATRQG